MRNSLQCAVTSLVATLLLASCATPPAPTSPAASPQADERQTPTPAAETKAPSPTTQRLRDEAAKLAPLAATTLGRDFLRATYALPAQGARVVYQDPQTREYFSEAKAGGLPNERRTKLAQVSLDEERYYYTKYGTSLAYLRAIDLASLHGFQSAAGKRVFDFGYGSIAHLRLLASLGAQTVGADPDSYLDALYSQPTDVGVVPPAWPIAGAGSVTLIHSRWPLEASAIRAASASGPYDLWLSKNTLKRGYIKPERPAPKRQLIDLGVTDEVFLEAVFSSLKPGGLMLIYNLSPKPSAANEPYVPWSDGRSPYSRAQFEKAGFRVIAIDTDDSVFIRQMGLQLGWDKNAAGEIVNDLNTNLFALYTIVQRP